MSRVGALIIIFVLVGTVFSVGYAWLNAATALDDARQEQQHLRNRIQLLRSLCLVSASKMTRADLTHSLRVNFGNGHIIKEHGDQIEVDDIIIKFRGETVIDVSVLGEAS